MTPERLAEIERLAKSPNFRSVRYEAGIPLVPGRNLFDNETVADLIAHIRDLEAQVREARELIRGITDTLEPYEGRLRVRDGWAKEFWGSIAEAEEYTRATATPPSPEVGA